MPQGAGERACEQRREWIASAKSVAALECNQRFECILCVSLKKKSSRMNRYRLSAIRPWRTWPLASQILLGVLSILILTVSVGGILYAQDSGQTLEEQYQLRALGIAQSVSSNQQIVGDLEAGDPTHAIRKLATAIKGATGAAYVVVADKFGIRYSHPNPKLIGKRLEEGVIALDGKTHIGIDVGSLGRSANGIAPIFSTRGDVIGEVSVGILETQLNSQLALDSWAIVGYSVLILALSAMGSLLLARRIKRVTFGLEPASIASLLREREALLHGIREGMVGFDVQGRVTVINEEAERLLGLSAVDVGRTLDEIMTPGRLRDLLTGAIGGVDEVTITDDFLLVINRMEVYLAGRDIGSVVTVRDRTEVEGLIREVHAINGLTEALRAQEHEYANQLYIIVGLIEMGEFDQVKSYLSQVASTPSSISNGLKTRIEPPELAALLLAKITVAGEQSISLTISDDSYVRQTDDGQRTLLTIVGNLVDNAIEALAEQRGRREISVHITDERGILLRVDDNGPGVPADKINDVLTDGYTTKLARPGSRRGLGLALVSRIVSRERGTITVSPGPGGHFEVYLPDPSNLRAGPSGISMGSAK
jgi:two-component system CitB family sensor kinase